MRRLVRRQTTSSDRMWSGNDGMCCGNVAIEWESTNQEGNVSGTDFVQFCMCEYYSVASGPWARCGRIIFVK